MKIYDALDYDDILLVPTLSTVNSRSEVNLISSLKGRVTGKNYYPIFTAPMKGISGIDLVKVASENNVMGILHRFDSVDNICHNIIELSNSDHDFGVAIGMNDEGIGIAAVADNWGATLICVDVANGYINNLSKYIKELRKEVDCLIMTGNVVTKEGSKALIDAGADFVRVGIGSGNLCTTRETTGIGSPQLSALQMCRNGGHVVSDGGINSPARAVKSFVFGADYIMIGSLFGSANEAENDGLIYGMASRKLQEDEYGTVKSVEGRESIILPIQKRPFVDILNEFLNGIKSACTYLNCKSYDELKHVKNVIRVGRGTLK